MTYARVVWNCFKSLTNLFKRHMGKPVTIKNFTFEVTRKCNGQCIYCNIWKTKPTKETSIDIYEENLKPLHLFHKVKTIGVTGGEPFLRKDLVDLVSFLHKLCPHAGLGFTTNGLQPDLTLKRMMEIREITGNLSIGVSIDGFKFVDGFQRGNKNHWNLAWKTVYLLKKENFNVAVGSVITPYNIGEMVDFENYCLNRNVPHSLMTVGISKHYYNNNPSNNLTLTSDLMPKFKQICYNNPTVFRQYMYKYMVNPCQIMPCFSGYGSFFLNSKAEIYPCIHLTTCYGSLQHKSFGEIWRGNKAGIIRKFIQQEYCHCYTACEVSGWFKNNLLPIIYVKVAGKLGLA